jgi:RNA polymerase sigma factor (sigma-70 family)
VAALDDLASVFITHRKQLKWTAQKILGDAQSAEDLVHDAYLKAQEAAGVCEVRDPLSYAHQVVRHMAIDRYRRTALESHLFEDEASGLQVAASGGTPERLAIDRQHLTLVVRALAELPERARRIFEMYRLEGRTQREIALTFDISPTMVNFLIRDTLAHCRAALPGF